MQVASEWTLPTLSSSAGVLWCTPSDQGVLLGATPISSARSNAMNSSNTNAIGVRGTVE